MADEIVITRKVLKNIGEKLWDIRQETPITQTMMAKMLKKQQSFISSMESHDPNKRKVPSLLSLVPYLDLVGYEIVIREKVQPQAPPPVPDR